MIAINLNIMRITILIILLFLLFQNSQAQTLDSAYFIYREQFSTLMKTRGYNENEIASIINKYQYNTIKSNSEFAKLLSGLYTAKKNIAILLYFFDNNILKRILFEPGKIIEEKKITITKEELSKLAIDLSNALNLYKLSANRSPQIRGIPQKQDTSIKVNFNEIVKRITSLLIPQTFDEKYTHLFEL